MPRHDPEVIEIDLPLLKPDQIAYIERIRRHERWGAAALVEVLGGVAKRQVARARERCESIRRKGQS